MTREELAVQMYDLIERIGVDAIVHEYILYATSDELREFIEHCQDMWEIE